RFTARGPWFSRLSEPVYLHPACYAIEGFWIWHAVSGSQRHLDIARAALAELLSFRLPSGGFPQTSAGSGYEEQADVLAQVTRLALVLGQRDQADIGLARLAASTVPAPPGVAVVYAPGASQVHESSWPSMFALQAFALSA